MDSGLSIQNFSGLSEFVDYNKQVLSDHYFEYFHIHVLLERLKNSKIKDVKGFTFKKSEETVLLYLQQHDASYVYSENFSNEDLDLLINDINFSEISTFRGSKDLILNLQERAHLNFTLDMERVMRKCISLHPGFNIEGQLIVGRSKYTRDILRYCKLYIEEDFSSVEDHNIEKILHTALLAVSQNKIAGWIVDDQLVSIIQIINNKKDKPYLGALYTHPDFRGKGYAKALMSSFSNQLFENGIKAIGSMTAKTNPGSNKVLQECGYHPISDWIKVNIT